MMLLEQSVCLCYVLANQKTFLAINYGDLYYFPFFIDFYGCLLLYHLYTGNRMDGYINDRNCAGVGNI